MSVAATSASRPLRLLMLADGHSIHTERWIRGLADSGPLELDLVTMNPAGVRAGLRAIEGLSRIHELYAGDVREAGGNWRYLRHLPRLWALVRRRRPDAIVAQYLSSYGALAAVVKGRNVLAQVTMGTDVMVTPQRNAVYRALASFALRRADVVVSVSQAVTARIATLAGLPASSILTQQYGLEDWIIDHPPLPMTWDFVSNRAWVENSNIPELLRLYHRLNGTSALALVGGGPAEPVVRSEAASDPRVQVLGALDHPATIDIVARSRFYLSMTASDGTSLSLLEAMALGAVPLVSDIGPNREWIDHGVNGALLPLNDPAEAARRIAAFAAMDVEALDGMRARNRTIVRERASMRRNIARFRQCLEALGGRRQ